MERVPSSNGTPKQWNAFCGAGSEFSRQLNAYMNERIDIKVKNLQLAYIAVGLPFLLFFILFSVLPLHVLTQDSVLALFRFSALCLILGYCVAAYILYRLSRTEKEGTAYLRKTEEENVALLRELAKKDYPQEKPTLL
jgi:hypothetical protein